jgi:hypothetical protein
MTITLSKLEARSKAYYQTPHSLVGEERHLIKKEATPKHKGLKKKDLRLKKEATPKHKGLKKKDL